MLQWNEGLAVLLEESVVKNVLSTVCYCNDYTTESGYVKSFTIANFKQDSDSKGAGKI